MCEPVCVCCVHISTCQCEGICTQMLPCKHSWMVCGTQALYSPEGLAFYVSWANFYLGSNFLTGSDFYINDKKLLVLK